MKTLQKLLENENAMLRDQIADLEKENAIMLANCKGYDIEPLYEPVSEQTWAKWSGQLELGI